MSNSPDDPYYGYGGESPHPGQGWPPQGGQPPPPGSPGGSSASYPYPPPPGDPSYGSGPAPGQPPQGYPAQPGGQYGPHGGPGYGPPPGPPSYGAASAAPQVHGRQLAEWWERFLARIIDAVVVAVPVGLVSSVALGAIQLAATGSGELRAWTVFDLVAGLVFVGALVAYEFLMLTRAGGRTLGKMALGLRVVPQHSPPQPDGGLPPNTAVLRGLIWWGPAYADFLLPIPVFGGLLSFVFVLINGLWPLWDQPYRHSLNDKLTGTVVVKDR